MHNNVGVVDYIYQVIYSSLSLFTKVIENNEGISKVLIKSPNGKRGFIFIRGCEVISTTDGIIVKDGVLSFDNNKININDLLEEIK